ncbi:MAG: hypothetical protein JO368_09020, partial [Acidimicrobiales bacterium]|nr:hypothetical protein [Acidimicrobiales bacterium]
MIAGLPRSGTTWTQEVMVRATGVVKVGEPDNEDKHPASIYAKRKLGRYPVLAPGEDDRDYRHLWEWILGGAREDQRDRLALAILKSGSDQRIHDGRHDPRAWLAGRVARGHQPAETPPGRVVTKSIHLQLALEWVAANFDVDMLVLFRHPANVLASWIEV